MFGFQKFPFNVFQMSLAAHTSNKWYLDSGCSRHMTGDRRKFTELVEKKGGQVVFGGKNKGNILGSGTITGKVTSHTIENVLLVDSLEYCKIHEFNYEF